MSFGRRYLLKLYLKTRLPFVPIYGGFPVKLRTHVGEPIPYDQNLTAEELQLKVRTLCAIKLTFIINNQNWYICGEIYVFSNNIVIDGEINITFKYASYLYLRI